MDGERVYDTYSRPLNDRIIFRASVIPPRQDLTAYLIGLRAAAETHGTLFEPEFEWLLG